MTLSFPKARYDAGIADFGTGSYAYLQPDGGWGLSNCGLVTSDGEALLIDTMFDYAHTREMLNGFARSSGAKIRTLFNTHHNGDHCYGNALVEGAQIVATEGAKTETMGLRMPRDARGLAKAAPGLGLTGEYLVHCFGDFDFENCSVRAPDTTFTGETSRMVGAKRVDLIEVGPAHTGGDALVYVPDDKTLFTGDILFIDGHPIMWAGPVENWIAACDAILDMDVETIVPGHGPVTDKKGVGARLKDLSRLHPRRSEKALRQRHWRAGSGALDRARRFRGLGRCRAHRRQCRDALPRIRLQGRTRRCRHAVRLDGAIVEGQSMSLIVYEHPLSPYAQKVKIALDEKGAMPYEAQGHAQRDRQRTAGSGIPESQSARRSAGADRRWICGVRFDHHPRIYRGQMADAADAAEVARRRAPMRAPSKR